MISAVSPPSVRCQGSAGEMKVIRARRKLFDDDLSSPQRVEFSEVEKGSLSSEG